MKTDRELVERAAKAVYVYGEWEEHPEINGRDTSGIYVPGQAFLWNPLTDDGDALRLACALRINIEHAETLSRIPHGVNCWPVGRGDCGHMENDIADYPAAVRRSIVTAAASMARKASA